MRWMFLLAIALSAGCGDDPDVYSLDGGDGASGGSGGGTQDSGSDAGGGAQDSGSD